MKQRARVIVGTVLAIALFASAATFVVFRERPAVKRLENLALFWSSRIRFTILRARGALFRRISGRSGGVDRAEIPNSEGKEESPFQFLDIEGFRYSVKPLFDDSYYQEVLDAIKRAKKSVRVALSYIDMGRRNSPADRLVYALTEARKRGVDVEVVLDYPHSRFGEVAKTGPYKKNECAIEFLKKKGCEASFDTPERTLHDKLILIDDGLAIIGTHDWTKNSLSANNEVSVLVKCSPTNAVFREHFEKIEREHKPEGREARLQEILGKQKELLGR